MAPDPLLRDILKGNVALDSFDWIRIDRDPTVQPSLEANGDKMMLLRLGAPGQERPALIDGQAPDMWLKVGGKRCGSGSARTMVFDAAALMSDDSRFMSQQPGAVISPGTPPGVAMDQRSSPVCRRPEQVMRLGVAGPGEQRQHTVPANLGAP
jgi:hypothetical protein